MTAWGRHEGSLRRWSANVETTPPRAFRETVKRAAEREFQILEGINHPGFLRAFDCRQHERWPALIFDHDPDAKRLDHSIKENRDSLTEEARPKLLRNIAETIQYAHEQHLDLLERFGLDLLDCVDYLEEQGVSHRDIKPENLAVSRLGKKRLHLVLFDFSLARAPAENIRAGTHPYWIPSSASASRHAGTSMPNASPSQ